MTHTPMVGISTPPAVSVSASDRLPYVGYATPLAIRRAGRLVATTGSFIEDMMATCNHLDCWEIVLFPTGILSWLGVVGLKKTSGQKLSSGLLLTFTSPLPIPLRRY